MVTVESDVTRSAGITTVRVVITNNRSTPQTVRIDSLLDGPVWPPRRNGVVDPRWDGTVWAGAIRPERRRGVGFASPAPPIDPPVELVSCDRCDSAQPARSPSEVLAELEGWSPTTTVLEDRS